MGNDVVTPPQRYGAVRGAAAPFPAAPPSNWYPFNNFVIFRPICFKFGLEVDLRMGNGLKVTGTKSFNWSFYENVLRWSSSRLLTLDFLSCLFSATKNPLGLKKRFIDIARYVSLGFKNKIDEKIVLKNWCYPHVLFRLETRIHHSSSTNSAE